MDARRAGAPEIVIFSTGLHWTTLAPGLLFLVVAGAARNWGTAGLLERAGLEALPERVMAATGFELDTLIATLAVVIGVPAFARGLVRALCTSFRVTSRGVRWEQRGFGAHDLWAGFESVESVQVQQGVLGRILGYGTVSVLGRNAIGRRRRIAQPHAFRKAADDQTSKWLCRDLGTGARRKTAAG
jgi:hypothetical protein